MPFVREPVGGVDGDFSFSDTIFEEDFFIVARELKNFFRNFHVLLTVLFDIGNVALAPPLHRLEAIATFLCAECCLRNRVEAEPSSE